MGNLRIAVPRGAEAGDGARLGLGVLSSLLGFRFRRIQNHLARGLVSIPDLAANRPGLLSSLAIISANPGVSQVMLAREAGLDKATLVMIIDDLEHAGLARRKRDTDDRRRNLLFTTPKGEKMLEQWIALARGNEAKVRACLTPAEFDQLSEMLDRIYDSCFGAVEG